MKKKFFAVSLIACAAAMTFAISPAFAQANSSGAAAKKPPAAATKTFAGMVKSISTSSIALLVGKKDYTIRIGTSTRLENRLFQKILLSKMEVGDKTSAIGPAPKSSSLTIIAKTIRDFALPRKASSSTSS